MIGAAATGRSSTGRVALRACRAQQAGQVGRPGSRTPRRWSHARPSSTRRGDSRTRCSPLLHQAWGTNRATVRWTIAARRNRPVVSRRKVLRVCGGVIRKETEFRLGVMMRSRGDPQWVVLIPGWSLVPRGWCLLPGAPVCWMNHPGPAGWIVLRAVYTISVPVAEVFVARPGLVHPGSLLGLFGRPVCHDLLADLSSSSDSPLSEFGLQVVLKPCDAEHSRDGGCGEYDCE